MFKRCHGYLQNHTEFKTRIVKIILFGAAHTYIAYVGEYSPRNRRKEKLCW